MRYRLEIPGDVRRYLRRLSPERQQRIVARMEQIAAAPYNSDISKALHGQLASVRSSQVGGFRILFEVDETAGSVAIHDIGPRGDIYKGR